MVHRPGDVVEPFLRRQTRVLDDDLLRREPLLQLLLTVVRKLFERFDPLVDGVFVLYNY